MQVPYKGKTNSAVVWALWIVGIVLFVLLGLETICVKEKHTFIQNLDAFFISLIRSHPSPTQSHLWLCIVQASTWFAQSKLTISLALLIALYWVFLKRYALGIWFFSTVLIGEIALKIFKNVMQRARPSTNGILAFAHGFSYPSGHALAASLFYGLLLSLVYFGHLNKSVKGVVCSFLLLWILFMMYDRVYLGVHYPTDVLGGFLMGIAWVSCSMGFYLGYLKRH
ncbi:phosphatase PAP2 family protein [Helicobacter suis]|uniref:phosphatase PAP2 family protein n=1 Tax=Helicobacter suis TaxID=104628 RepID=UPI0013D7077C|nr:phosphatase PAP2 family protein [Helicobacter suis]